MKMAEEDAFYMAIQEPRDFRRELLESNKKILQMLQRLEYIKQLRVKKIELMFNYSETMNQISMLSNKLKRTVPVTKLRNMPKVEMTKSEAKTVQLSAGKKSTEEHVNSKELMNLKRELDEIEGKLANLEK
jgi:hypothetical protein